MVEGATGPSAQGAHLLHARRVTKRFPGVAALRDVDLVVGAGEIVAVIGENGAGKSTLMKILAGILPMDGGTLWLDGSPVAFTNARQAAQRGIVLIHQELSLLPNLTVGANIFLGREPHKAGWIQSRMIAKEAAQIIARVGLALPTDTLVGSLPIGQRQLLEIARVLSVDARLIIMDEPTSSLSEREADRLFAVIRELKDAGVSILFVSHRLREVEAIADRVVVLMDGQNAAELTGSDIRRERMARSMVGRDISSFYARKTRTKGDCVMAVSGVSTMAWPNCRVSLQLHAGEIVGLAGLVGAGRTELLRTLFGLDPMLHGTVRINGNTAVLRSPRDAMAQGIALVPEDRAQQGLVLPMLVRHNMSLAALTRRAASSISRAWEEAFCEYMMRRLRIDGTRKNSVARLLSGGNQQKVVLGKWLLLGPRVLLLDEPTRGIDVGAKQEIYHTMEELAEDGMAILFASSELEEILGIADRVLVMHEGRMTGELEHKDMAEENIMQLATGQTL